MSTVRIIKRYVVFAGSNFYPRGGWDDFQSSHDSLEEALAAPRRGDWFQVVDLTTGGILESGQNG
jgi:hypothetical protein